MQEIELLFKISQLYYEQGLTQNDIAKKLFISRSNISRLLKQAQELGIVEITVHYPSERKRRIEVEFNNRFHLDEIRVVDLSNRTGYELYTATTKLAAAYLNMQLNNDSVLALTCGNSLCGMVHELRPKSYLPGMQVVPLMGSIESQNIILDGYYLVRQVAEVYGCRYQCIMAPFRVDDAVMCQNLMRRPAMIETMSLAENATIMCTGIGADMQSGYLAKNEHQAFFQHGAVGYIAGYYFDENGNILDMPDIYGRLITASRKMFEIPTRCAVVADIKKARATLAALRGGLINALITNNVVASLILSLDSAGALSPDAPSFRDEPEQQAEDRQ